MADVAQSELVAADEVAGRTRVASAVNGLRYSVFGELRISSDDLLRLVEAVPAPVARILSNRVYCFVPLAISEADTLLGLRVAASYKADLADRATCHRDVTIAGMEYTFISSHLMQDRFALAFELFINIGHQYADESGLPDEFVKLAWDQAKADVRGETSLDAYEHRKQATNTGSPSEIGSQRASRRPRLDEALTIEEAKDAYLEAAFADALAIYMLSLALDIDYADLRERDYPLLAAPALAERLRLLAKLFPAGPGYTFAIRYRRRA